MAATEVVTENRLIDPARHFVGKVRAPSPSSCYLTLTFPLGAD